MSKTDALTTSDAALKSLEGGPGYIPAVISDLFGATESAEQWENYEHLISACLRIGDEKSAHGVLERLVIRFGTKNERVMALRGLYQEAVANDRKGLETVLKEYDTILEENPANIPIAKRRAVLMKSLSRPEQAIETLVALLQVSPTDVEAWCELSDLYLAQGYYTQAVFCLEEGLLTFPNAWNLHAKLGEVLYMSAAVDTNTNKTAAESNLANSVRRFARSIELCSGYLRGYYGLILATEKYISTFADTKFSSGNEASLSLEEAKGLKRVATTGLGKIVNDKESSYDASEVAAAEKLLLAAA